jgi:hypothetical protein
MTLKMHYSNIFFEKYASNGHEKLEYVGSAPELDSELLASQVGSGSGSGSKTQRKMGSRSG